MPAPLVPSGISRLTDDLSVGVPYAYRLEWLIRGGVPPLTWDVAMGSSLPSGLAIQPGANGVPAFLAGVVSTPGFYNFSLTATDAVGQTLTLPLALNAPGVALSVPSLPHGVVGTPLSVSLGPSGGVPPLTVALHAGTDLPAGLSLSSAGVLSGTPQSAGSFIIGVRVIDAIGTTLQRGYFVTIDDAAGEAPAVGLSPKPIQIYYELGSPAPAPVPIGVTGTSGSSPFTLSLTGAPWANLSTGTGTAPTSVNLSVDTSGLGVGTYTSFLGVVATTSVNRTDFAPVVLTVAPAPPCTYAVNPTNGTAAATGGSGSFSVSAGSTCSWTATTADSWITITSGTSGTGGGAVAFTAAANPGLNPRSGTISVNGAVYSLTQFGSTCSFALIPSSLAVSASGGSGTIGLAASNSSCTWTASGLSASPNSGTGSALVGITIPVNTNALSRVLTATIGGLTLTVNQSGGDCMVALDSSAASYGSGGGSGAVVVTTTSGCGYGTVLGPSWISVTSGGSGGSSGTLLYSVQPNPTTFPRSGALVIGGQPFLISQEALACSITLDTSGLGSPYGPGGGSGNIGVTANGGNCSWTASSDGAWASVSPGSGTGNGTVFVNVTSNGLNPASRLANLLVGGTTIPLNQLGTACTYSLQSLTASVPGLGGGGAVGVVTAPACTWSSATNSPTWLSITSSGSAGSADVQFVAQANPSTAPRSGTLTVAGLAYTVNQAGAPCTYSLSSSGVSISADGGTDSFTYSSSGGCAAPTVTSFAGWVHLTPSAPGTVAFGVDVNPFAVNRTGVIQVADRVFTVTQLGGACAYSLNQYGALFSHTGGLGTILGSPSALSCTPTVGTDQPSIITLGPLAGPLLNIFTQPYSVAPVPPPISPLRSANDDLVRRPVVRGEADVMVTDTRILLQRDTMRDSRIALAGIRRAVALLLLCAAPAVSWASTRGPDGGGYTATDATVYSFVDISGGSGGSSVLSGTDDGTALLTLPFTFQLYGQPHTLVCVSSNGAIYFVPGPAQCGGIIDFNNTDLTTVASPGDFPAVFPWWSDLSFQVSGAGSVFYQTTGAPGSRRFIVQWERAFPAASPNPVTFQAILFEGSNRIVFRYKTADLGDGNAATKGSAATIGIRDAAGQTTLKQIEWSYNAGVVTNEMALLFDGSSQAPSTTSLYALPSSVGALQPVFLIAVVNSPTGGTPNGAVQFRDGATVIGNGTVTNGVAALVVNGLSSGAHSLTAAFAGSGNIAPSTSAPASVTVQSAAASTFTFAIQWTNPAAQGQPVLLSALVRPLAGTTTPAGNVQFKEGGTILGTAALANGLATVNLNSLSVGTHTIIAQYLGGGTFAGSLSPAVVQTIYSGSRPQASAVALAASPSPSTFGQPVTFMATVTPTTAVPTGNVYFYVDDLPVGSAAVSLVGGVYKATLTTSGLTRGAHVINAVYLGNASVSSSTSLPVVQIVQ